MHLIYLTKKSKSCSKSWLIFESESICFKENSYEETETVKSIGSMYRYQFLFLQIWPWTYFPLQYSSRSTCLNLFYCSRRISYPRLNSDEIKNYWRWNSNHDKAVQITGTAEPETQPSSSGDGLCRWFYRWRWGTRPIYPVPANAKKQLVVLQEHFECYCNVLPDFGFNSA